MNEDSRKLLRLKSKEEKYQLVHMYKESNMDRQATESSPESIIERLKNKRASQSEILSTLNTCRICCTNLDLKCDSLFPTFIHERLMSLSVAFCSWIVKFRDLQGLQALLEVLHNCSGYACMLLFSAI